MGKALTKCMLVLSIPFSLFSFSTQPRFCSRWKKMTSRFGEAQQCITFQDWDLLLAMLQCLSHQKVVWDIGVAFSFQPIIHHHHHHHTLFLLTCNVWDWCLKTKDHVGSIMQDAKVNNKDNGCDIATFSCALFTAC